jgi:hypothetical protein
MLNNFCFCPILRKDLKNAPKCILCAAIQKIQRRCFFEFGSRPRFWPTSGSPAQAHARLTPAPAPDHARLAPFVVRRVAAEDRRWRTVAGRLATPSRRCPSRLCSPTRHFFLLASPSSPLTAAATQAAAGAAAPPCHLPALSSPVAAPFSDSACLRHRLTLLHCWSQPTTAFIEGKG